MIEGNSTMRRMAFITLAFGALAAWPGASRADPVADFYNGRTVTVIVG